MNTKWKWSYTYEFICNASLSLTDIVSLWSDRWFRDVLMKSGRKEVTDSPQWQEKPCLSAGKQPVERWTDRSSLTEHTLVFTSVCEICFCLVLKTGHHQWEERNQLYCGRSLRLKTSPVQSECRKVLHYGEPEQMCIQCPFIPFIAFLKRFNVNIYFWYIMRVRYKL